MPNPSFIKTLQNYFSADGGKKLSIPELKSLTYEDKLDLHAELLKVGETCDPPMSPAEAAAA